MNPSWVDFLVAQQDYAAFLLMFSFVVLFTRIGWQYFFRRLDRLNWFAESPDFRWRRPFWLIIVAFLPMLGWFVTEWSSRRYEVEMRKELLRRVQSSTLSVDIEDLRKLRGSIEDMDKQAYRRLVSQLANMKLANEDVRNVYILGYRQKQVIFYADAEPTTSDKFSPPGCVYKEAKPEFIGALLENKGIVEGPLRDSYGTWVSSSFPLRDPQTGAAIAMLGMDIDADLWEEMVKSYREIFIGLIFLASLLVLFFYYLSKWFSETAARMAASERRHRELAALQQAMLDSAEYAIIAISHDGRIQMFNNGAERMFGYAAAEVVGGKTLGDLRAPGERDGAPGSGEALPQGKTYEGEWLLARKDGSCFPGFLSISPLRADDGQASGHLCIATDITERRQKEELLRQLQSSVQQAVESIIVTTAQLERPGPEIIFANAGFSRMTGYAVEEVIGKTPRMFQGRGTRREFLDHLKRNLSMGMPFLGDTINYRKDGTPYEVEVRISPVRDSKGVVTNFVAVQNDISARRRVERDLQYRDRLLGGVSAAGHKLLEGVTAESIQAALEILGRAAKVDRVYIFENSENPLTGETLMSQRYEWVEAGVKPEIDNPMLQHLSYAPVFSRWLENMSKELPVYGPVRYMSPAERERLESRGILSLLEVPITIDGRFWGFIGFDDCHEPRLWTKTEIGTLTDFADDIGNAIIRMRAAAEIADARQREVMVAAKIQKSLLVPPSESLPGSIDLAAVSIASQEVDGDFYDFFVHGPNCFDVVIGDVMGKGIPAALLGAATKNAISRVMVDLTLANQIQACPSPQEIMAQTEKRVAANMAEVDSFVTLCYARLDTDQRRLTWIDLGHTRSLLYRHGRKTHEWLKGEGLPLGTGIHHVNHQQTTAFEPGDILVLYSDGIPEATNATGDFFGEDRLCSVVREHAECEAQTILHRILATVSAFAAGTGVVDDRTCIVIKASEAGSKSPLPGAAALELSSDLDNLPQIREFIRGFCRRETAPPAPDEVIDRLELAGTEIASNLMRHSFGGEPYHRIRLSIEVTNEEIVLRFFHWGGFYEPPAIDLPDFDDYPEGGFGLFLVKQSVDSLTFSQNASGRCCTELRLRRT